MASSTELGNMLSADVVARMVASLLVLMVVLLVAQMVVLPGWFWGVFGVCFFNRPRH